MQKVVYVKAYFAVYEPISALNIRGRVFVG